MSAEPGTVSGTEAETAGWPAELAARYRKEGFWRDCPLGEEPWRWAEAYGDRPALVDGAVSISYTALAELADGAAECLADQGLRSGDRILVQLPTSWELVAVLLACWRAGVVPVLALTTHREYELDYLARLAEVRMLIVVDRRRGFDHQRLAGQVAAALPWPCAVAVVGDDVAAGHGDVRRWFHRSGDVAERRGRLDAAAPGADEVALFLLSGGTTGRPKMIGRTHNDYEYNIRRSGEVCGFGAETVYLAALPAAHNFPLGCPGILGTLRVGGRVVLVPSPEPGAAFRVIGQERVTVTSLVPAVLRRWIEAAAGRAEARTQLASLAVVQVGGSPLDPALARAVEPELGARLQQVFGMAEGLLCYTRAGDPQDVRMETQGRPISAGDELRVVANDGHDVPPGEVGELLVRGPYTLRGYYRAPEYNRIAFTDDGWYRTGDLVRLRPDGNLRVVGRSKDIVNRGGEKISAAEVEQLARELLGLSEVAVVPVPDTELGERICLVVVRDPGRGERSVASVARTFRDRGVAEFKIPEAVVEVDGIPLTAVGKVDKNAIREMLARG